jgi:hypothetical protein
MPSLKGQLIFDGGQLAGSDFQHTVMLVCPAITSSFRRHRALRI